jgi:predicted Abi (CAAX) family protease
VDSIAARFNLRYNEQKWLNATAQLVADDPHALKRFVDGDITLFASSQFNQLGGLAALAAFREREDVLEALRQSSLVRHSKSGVGRDG